MRNRKGDTIDRKEKALGNEQAESPRSVSPVSAPKAVDKQQGCSLLAQKRPKIQRSEPSQSTQEQLKGREMVRSSRELVNSPGRRHLDWEGRQPRPRQESVGSDLHTG